MRKYRLLFIDHYFWNYGDRAYGQPLFGLRMDLVSNPRTAAQHGHSWFSFFYVPSGASSGRYRGFTPFVQYNVWTVCSEMLYSLAGSAIWHVCSGSLHAVSASWRLIRFRKPVSTSVRADSVLCDADLLVSE